MLSTFSLEFRVILYWLTICVLFSGTVPLFWRMSSLKSLMSRFLDLFSSRMLWILVLYRLNWGHFPFWWKTDGKPAHTFFALCYLGKWICMTDKNCRCLIFYMILKRIFWDTLDIVYFIVNFLLIWKFQIQF
jgi:hypothetical protein